ncbi:MAG: Lipoprotein [Shouchella clausii]
MLFLGVLYYFWNKDQQEKAEANRALHNTYSYTAGGLHLDVDTSEYDRTGDPHDIELTPTDLTYDLLQRWEAIAEVIPTIDYPEEAVEKEDWLEVFSTLANNRYEAMDVSKEITQGEEYGSANSMVINDYIDVGSVYNDDFREFLEENGIEAPDQRRLE